MSMNRIFRSALAIGLLAVGGNAFAQEVPTVDSIIDSLKSEPVDTPQVDTRALRPGAASMSTTAPVPTAAPKPPKAASINMQINFDFNSDRISRDSERTMATLAQALSSSQLEGRNFTVVGHTDAKGSAAYNKALSDRRAASVRRYLIDNGVAASRLRAVGKGESQLLNDADPEAAENRRVEIQATGG